jgi:hypothetical protein
VLRQIIQRCWRRNDENIDWSFDCPFWWSKRLRWV